MVKRHDHYEKSALYQRWKDMTGLGDRPSFAFPINMLKEFLDLKLETHNKMSKLPDEEIVTWSVGSHIYKQGDKIIGGE